MIAFAVIAIGAVISTGWVLGSPAMVRVLPGSVAMGLNTALALIAAGIWLLMRGSRTPGAQRVRIGLALFLVVLFTLILLEHIFAIDLGIDWRELHQRIPDQNRLPGRVAPNTSIALLTCGIAFLLREFDLKHGKALSRALGVVILAIGVSGIVGYALDLEWLYRWYRLNRMALPTAAALTLLGIALLLETAEARRFRVRDADKLIVARGVATLALLATAFLFSGFVVLREGVENSIRRSFLQTAEDNRALMISVLEQHARMAKLVATSPILIDSVVALQTGGPGALERRPARSPEEVRQRFKALGFSRIDIYDRNGVLLAGQFPPPPAQLRVELKRFGEATELIWVDGFLLSHRLPLQIADETIGSVVLEQPLSSGFAHHPGLGETGERRLCAQSEGRLRCFPSSPSTKTLDLPLLRDGQPSFPVARAILLGEKGVTRANDYGGRPVLAAYVPIEAGTLGMVLKQEVDELFAPLRKRLALLFGLVVLLVAGSVLILRSAVRPLTAQLLRAETTAREHAGALRASMQALSEASSGLRASEQQVRALNSELEHRVAERTADLTRANDDLRQFAYAASHDLQEPLRNITLFSQFVQRRYSDQIDAQVHGYLDLIAANAQRMQQLLRDVLAYTQAGEALEGNGTSDPMAALDEVVANLHSAIVESGAQIERDALPDRVGIHHTHLVQLLQNLIGNAIKYRSANALRVRIAARREQGRWVFSVRDNGIGIEKQYLEQIFGVFRRLHKSEYPGTGIGLAICQKIVQRYDGSIWAESAPGEGTTIYFSLPAAPADDA